MPLAGLFTFLVLAALSVFMSEAVDLTAKSVFEFQASLEFGDDFFLTTPDYGLFWASFLNISLGSDLPV